MVRTDRWKLTGRFPSGPDELYGIGADPGEKINLIGTVQTQHLTVDCQLVLAVFRQGFGAILRTPAGGSGR